MKAEEVIAYLKSYNGRILKIMEVCGTHTSSIFKNGIRQLISDKIQLISGPGCPVCVTPSAYIDRCIAYAKKEKHVLLTFGDMMKVPGTEESLAEAKGEGAQVELMYSPLEALMKAAKNKEITYVVAAVGFETTVPIYAVLIEEAQKRGIKNLRLVTSLKTVLPALSWICESAQTQIDGFLCPGHVSVVMGSQMYEEFAKKYQKPCVIGGFEAEHILAAIYQIVRQLEKGESYVENLYKNAVKEGGNRKAREMMSMYFEEGSASWRGLGKIESSGLYLNKEFAFYDGGSRDLDYDKPLPEDCSCAQVIIGKKNPNQCKMFGKACKPENPYGPCMVSTEGACGIWYSGGAKQI